MAFNIEGADEFSQFNIPQAYDYNWDMTPWIESPLSFQGSLQNPYSGSNDDLANLVGWQPQYSNLDIAKYRYDPFGGYMQYMDKAGNIGYMQGTGKQLGEGISMAPNMYNEGLAKWKDPNQADWFQMQYDPYGPNGQARSPYKIREDVGQGWFSKNMDWLVPSVIAGLGGGMALSGVGMNPAAAGAVGADAGLGVVAGGTGAGSTSPLLSLSQMSGNPMLGAGLGGLYESPIAAGLLEAGAGAGGLGAMTDIFGPPIDLANPGINPLPEFAGPAADLAGGSPWYQQAFDWMKSPLGQMVTKGVGKLGSAYFQDKMAKNMQGDMENYINRANQQADPFGPERSQYQDLLEQSYKDPMALFNSPEYQGLARLFTEQINRRDAAKGRTVAGELPRAMELQDNFMKWLSDYRSGLQNPAGTTINPNGVLAGLAGNLQNALTNRYNAMGGYTNAISQIFDPYANEKDLFSDKLTKFLESLG